MKKSKRFMKVLSVFLLIAFAFSIASPAMAASFDKNTVSVSVDGRAAQVYEFTTGTSVSDTKLYELGARNIASVEVTGEGYKATHHDFNAAEGTMQTGTEYVLFVKEDGFGNDSLYFATRSGISDDIQINVTTEETRYTVVANSGVYGDNNNQGTSGDRTCSVDTSSQTVNGGDTFLIRFTPASGQDITHLNIRKNYTNANANIIALNDGVDYYTADGRSYQIEKNANGIVTLRGSAASDLLITALTEAKSDKVTLSVITDSNCDSNVGTEKVATGSTKSVTIAPEEGYNISDIVITDGNATGTIAYDEDSVSVNGKTYRVSRDLDGSVVLSIPAMNSDVTVNVSSSNRLYRVIVNETSLVDSDESGLNFVRRGDSFVVTYEPYRDSVIRTISVKTPKGTYTARTDDDYLVIEGQYHRMYWDGRGNVSIYLNQISSNMEFSVNAKDTLHDVVINTDRGVESDSRSYYDVMDGEDLTVSFRPTDSHYSIQSLRVVYDGQTHYADLNKDSYIRVDGHRWYVRTDKDGVVTLEMIDIGADVTVTASTNYYSTNNMTISKNPDTHSTITYTGTNPFRYNDSTTVRVYADKDYVLKSVIFRMGGKSVTVKPMDKSFSLNGNTYTVTWKDSAEFSVYVPYLTGSLSVISTSEKGNVSQPVQEQKPQQEVQATSGYHSAYMVGFPNGNFGPNESLTRAQAVTLLSRVCGGANSAGIYTNKSYFPDVRPTDWFAGPVSYAAANGFLDIVTIGNNFNPDQPVTRAEFLAMLCNFRGVDVTSVYQDNSLYNDVGVGHWALRYINYATYQGWVSGTGTNVFSPDSALTRAEAVTMINHILGRSCDAAKAAASGPTFNDVPISHWAFYEIFEASHNHHATIINGVETWD